MLYWVKLNIINISTFPQYIEKNVFFTYNDKLYYANISGVLNKQEDIDVLNNKHCMVEAGPWQPNITYRVGAIVIHAADYYVCVTENKLKVFNVGSSTETTTSGNFFFGLYASPMGKLESLAKVPKHNGLIYIDREKAVAYVYIKENDGKDITANSFGWTLLSNNTAPGMSVIPHAPVKVDNVTVHGDGTNIPLSASCSIPDYDKNKEYAAGNVVHHTVQNIEGIYRADVDIAQAAWVKLPTHQVIFNIPTTLAHGTYFCIQGAQEVEYNKCYITDTPDYAISFIISSGNLKDLKDHIDNQRIHAVTPWIANKPYIAGDIVAYGTYIYKCVRNVTQEIFNTENDYLKWTLLADISNANNNLPIGAVLEYFGVKPPSGWLFCDGREVYKESINPFGIEQEGYPLLYNVIESHFSTSNTPVDKFKLPTADNKIIKAY